MEEVKISKKSKVGILSFVTGFEEFAELAETIFRNAERRGDLDKAYVKLIRAVFMNGESSATPPPSLRRHRRDDRPPFSILVSQWRK